MLHILFVHIRFPEYDKCSGDLRLTNLLHLLSRKHQVVLHILYKPREYVHSQENRKYRKRLAELGIEVRYGSLRSSLRQRRYDLVFIEFWYVARHLFEDIRVIQPAARIVVDTEHLYFYSDELRAKALGGNIRSPETLKAKKDELRAYEMADLVIATTEEDKAVLLRASPSLQVATIPNIHSPTAFSERTRDYRKPNSLIFVGNFANNPCNVDAMLYFCEQVLPRVRTQVPDVSLSIVGNMPPVEIRRLASDHITVTGYVPEVEPYLASSMISICPLRFGAGLKGKIGEAMMHGLPVVTTSIGTQGMNARIGEDILVGDMPQDFANCIVALLRDHRLWYTLSVNGKALVSANYSFEAVERGIENVMAGVARLPIRRYGLFRRLALKSRLDFNDLLGRTLLWRLRRSE